MFSLLWAIFAVSAGVLAFEIGLLRVLLYASWHHFAFLIISIALLGFGASGTFLCYAAKRLAPGAPHKYLFWLTLAAALSMPLVLQIVRHIPVSARFVPATLGRSVLSWSVFWALLFIPFFLGASAIGLGLMRAGNRIAHVYASNLLGSAFGATAVTVAMKMVAPAWLGTFAGVVALLGTIPLLRTRRRVAGWTIALAVVALWLGVRPPTITTDPYKYISYVHRLQDEQRARAIATAYSARATVEVFEGGAFHDLPFLSGGVPPPPLMSVVVDGHGAGSVLDVSTTEGARIVDNLLAAATYSLLPAHPRVLLLGETGGVNVWVARRHHAHSIDVVQPNADIPALLRGPLLRRGGAILEPPVVRVHTADPRSYVEGEHAEYNLIQLVSLESWAVESGGIEGLSQDHLVTVQGLARCIDRLSPSGILAIVRGMQIPPRDNLKLLGTAIAALRQNGIEDVLRHVAIVRDYLAACMLVRRTPWTAAGTEAIRELCRRRELTPVYFPGIRDEELNQPDHLPGPAGAPGDWLHYGAKQLLSEDAEGFVRDWAFDIRPPTDDRPFFGNFMKPRSLTLLRQTFGDLWLTRTEVSLLFVVLALIAVGAVGAILTVVPLGFASSIRRSRRLWSTAAYFTAIGLGYMMLEMTVLSRLIHVVGDPVTAGALTISGFLFFSGLGSFASRRLSTRARTLAGVVAGVVVVALVEGAVFGRASHAAAGFPDTVRPILALLLVAPLGFLMGFPMPTALRVLDEFSPSVIPWAWGVNGFASVLAPPLATLIAMTLGFHVTGAIALVCYAAAAAVFAGLRTD